MNDSLLAAHTALSVGSVQGKEGLVFDIISMLPAPSMLMNNTTVALLIWDLLLHKALHKVTQIVGSPVIHLHRHVALGMFKKSLLLGHDIFSFDWPFYFVSLGFFPPKVNALQQ